MGTKQSKPTPTATRNIISDTVPQQLGPFHIPVRAIGNIDADRTDVPKVSDNFGDLVEHKGRLWTVSSIYFTVHDTTDLELVEIRPSWNADSLVRASIDPHIKVRGIQDLICEFANGTSVAFVRHTIQKADEYNDSVQRMSAHAPITNSDLVNRCRLTSTGNELVIFGSCYSPFRVDVDGKYTEPLAKLAPSIYWRGAGVVSFVDTGTWDASVILYERGQMNLLTHFDKGAVGLDPLQHRTSYNLVLAGDKKHLAVCRNVYGICHVRPCAILSVRLELGKEEQIKTDEIWADAVTCPGPGSTVYIASHPHIDRKKSADRLMVARIDCAAEPLGVELRVFEQLFKGDFLCGFVACESGRLLMLSRSGNVHCVQF